MLALLIIKAYKMAYYSYSFIKNQLLIRMLMSIVTSTIAWPDTHLDNRVLKP
jgi:hypothetical protein